MFLKHSIQNMKSKQRIGAAHGAACRSASPANAALHSPRPVMRNMPTLSPLILLAMLALPACQSPIKNSYELRKQAAGTIARAEALPTVWNIAAPLEMGRVYKRDGNEKYGYFLSPGSEVFVEQTKLLSQSQPNNTTWSDTRSGSWNVKPQLTYMGLKSELNLKNVRSVTFSLVGDTYQFVNNTQGFEDLLNLPTFGPKLRDRILEDTERLEANKLPGTEAKYWIVVQLLTAKNLAVTFNNVTTTSGGVEVVDPAKIAGWLNIKDLSPASIAVSNDQTRDAKLTSPDTVGLVAQCIPLKAYTSGARRGEVFTDGSTVLLLANQAK